jgi:hypothetical protein
MNRVSYEIDFGRHRGRTEPPPISESIARTDAPIKRIARLMALAIRIGEFVREGKIRDYAEAARLGRVTRARMTQITKLLDLAPDIQEQILFLPPTSRLTERSLRPIVNQTDWSEQRRRFQRFSEGEANTIRG